MDMLETIRSRRSIRKYTDEQVSEDQLKLILEAGLYAPNAGGGQRCKIIAIRNPKLADQIGRWNASCMDRRRLAGSYVSAEQPSLIDDVNLKSGFYGAPTVCAIFGPKNFLYSVPDAFCCAENMVLMAHTLGLATCIVARGEETFAHAQGMALLRQWGVSEQDVARCFVLLGHCAGAYPQVKPRKSGRYQIINQ